MNLKTRAIVLNALNFRDTSEVVSLFCEQGGKTPVMVKGSKAPKSPHFGKFEPGFRLELNLSVKSSRTIQQLVASDLVASLPDLYSPPGFGALVYNTIELTSQLLHEHQDHPEFFDFLWNLLEWSSKGTVRPDMRFFPYVQWRICALVGVSMALDADGAWLNLETGTTTNTPEGAFCYALSAWERDYFTAIRLRKTAAIFSLVENPLELNHLIQLFDRYLNFHVEGRHPRRAVSIFEQLER